MERFLGNFRAIKQSSSQKTKKYLFLARSTKTRKVILVGRDFFFARNLPFFLETVSYNPLVLGLGGHETKKNNTPPPPLTIAH